MQQPLEEHGSPQQWIFIFLIVGLIAITVLFLISRIFQYSGPELLNSPYSVNNERHTVAIGSARFAVPENTIRLPEQRQQDRLNKLDLILLWPSLEGFSLENQVAFSDTSSKSKIVYASLTQPVEAISSSDRLYAVYSQYFVGDPIKGPDQLVGFAMDMESGFSGETVYFKPNQINPFVARCIRPVEGTATFCMRDISLPNNVQLSYRFRFNMLKEWRTLDQAILSKFKTFQLQ